MARDPYQNIEDDEEVYTRTKHYQDFLDGKQWLEVVQDLPTYKDNPEKMMAALELQVRKYLDRKGRKTGEPIIKDLKKAYDYLGWMIQLAETGRIVIR